MIKAIIACGSTKFPQISLEFVKRLHQLEPLLATGMFLPQYDMGHLWLLGDPMYGQPVIPLPDEDENEAFLKNKDRFREECHAAGIGFCVHEDTIGMTGSLLQTETRFADVLFIDSEHYYEYMGTGASNPSLQDALHEAECPVILLSENAELPEINILAYDGSASSVYAIKQYAYLFPELSRKKTLLVHLSSDELPVIPQQENLLELLNQHYPDLTILNLLKDSKTHIEDHIRPDKNSIIVCGSYSRTLVSRIFKRSFAAELIDKHEVPLFIAHI